MPEKKTLLPDNERAKRIRELAREAETDNDPASFERAFERVAQRARQTGGPAVTETYDRYKNLKRPGDKLTLKAPFPAGAVAAEWKKQSTVGDTDLTELEKADLSRHGYAYSKMNVTFTVTEGVKLPDELVVRNSPKPT